MDETPGVLTTVKLQALLDSGRVPGLMTRQALADALSRKGPKISVHGINAWFRRAESNYSAPKPSLSDDAPSFSVPRQRWRTILEIFDVDSDLLGLSDRQFAMRCLGQQTPPVPFEHKPVATPGALDLVGRISEIRHLIAGFECARRGASSVCFIEGAAGIGKSRIIEHFVRQLPHRALPLHVICDQGNSSPLLSIIEGIGAALPRIMELDAQTGAALEAAVASFVSLGNSDQPHTLQSRLMSSLIGLARQVPVVAVVDDAHWMDEASLRLVEQLAHRLVSGRDKGIQLICVYRPYERQSHWPDTVSKFRGRDNCTFLPIAPMSESEIGQVLMADGSTIARSSISAIWEAAGGNPLHARQLFGLLLDRGHLQNVNGFLVLQSALEEIELPRGVGALFLGTLGELSDRTRELVTFAACLGRTFSARDLSECIPDMSSTEVATALDEAEDKGIIEVGAPRCGFVHPLARFAALQSITSSRLAYVHYQIALALERAGREIHPVDHARHLLKGAMYADPSVLTKVLFEAMATAHGFGSWDQVLQFGAALFEYGHSTLTTRQSGNVHRWMGDAWHKKGRPDDALTHLVRARELFLEAGDAEGLASVVNDTVQIRGNFGKVEPGTLEHAHELTELALSQNLPPALVARIRGTLAMQRIYAGDNQMALALTEESEKLLEIAADDRVACYVSMIRGLAFLNCLEVRESRDCFDRAYAFAERSNDTLSAAQSRQRMAIAELAQGNLQASVVCAKEAEAYGSLANQTGELALPLAMRATAHLALDQFDEALVCCRRGLEIAVISRYSWGAVYLVLAYTQVLTRLGDWSGALEMVRSLLVRGRFFDDPAPYRRLVGLIELYIRTLAGTPASADAVSTFAMSPLNENNCDLIRLCRYGVLLDLATRTNLNDQAKICRDALAFAAGRGVVCTPGWLFDVAQSVPSSVR